VRLADTRARELELVPQATMAVGYGLPEAILEAPGALSVFACSFAGWGIWTSNGSVRQMWP